MKLAFLILIFSQTAFVFSQSDNRPITQKTWSIGVITVGESLLDNSAGGLSSLVPASNSTRFLSGLVIKYNFQNFAIRTAFEYGQDSDDYMPGCCDLPFGPIESKNMLFRLGIEKGIILFNFFQPYIALDFAVSSTNIDYTIKNGGFVPKESALIGTVKEFNNGIGIIPAFGLTVMPVRNLSLGFESRYRILNTKTSADIMLKGYNGREDINEHETFDTKLVRQFKFLGAFTVNLTF